MFLGAPKLSRFFPPGVDFSWPLTSLVVIALLTTFLLSACARPTEADLVASDTSGQAPLSVTFTNESKNADEFQWDFGDGATTTSDNPDEPVTHQYTTAGTFTATLKAIKQGNPPETSTATVTITVEPGPLDHVNIEPSTTTMEVTKAQQFTATALDQFDNPVPGLTFSYQADAQAGSIDNQGKFTARTTAGIYESGVTVAVTQGAVTQMATATVTVEPGPLDQVNIAPSTAAVEVTEEHQFTPTALDQFDNPIPGLTFVFQSDTQAGQVDSMGRFTAGTEAGTYESGLTMEVTQGSAVRTATASITVGPGPLDRAVLEAAAPGVAVAQTLQFTATALDRFDNPISGLPVDFRADEQAGQVDNQGSFTAGTKAGFYESAVTMEVTQGAVTRIAAASVTLNPGPLDHVNLESATPTIVVTEEEQFTATALDQFDNPIPGLVYTFQADEPAGQVDSMGRLVAGTVAGTYDSGVTVEVIQGEITKTASVNVTLTHGPLERVLITPQTVELEIGETQEFSAEAVDAFDNPISEAQIVWEVVAEAGTISDEGLLTTGTRAGTFTQSVKSTATEGAVSAEATASVTVNPGALTISVPPIEVVAGATQQLAAIATDQFGNQVTDLEVTWVILDENAGSTTSSGLLTGGEVARSFSGVVEAVATQGDLTGAATGSVTITPGPLEQVVVAPDPVEIGMEMTQQFVAVGADRFGNWISGLDFTWSVVAGGGTVDASGVFTAGTEPDTYSDTVEATTTQGDITRSATASVTVEPDRISFISDRNQDQFDIFIMDQDGTNVQRVTGGGFSGTTWSPGGRRIAYSVAGFIVMISDDGSWPILVLERDLIEDVFHFKIEPAWSPDGSKIAFVSETFPVSHRDIFVADVDGGNVTQLTDTPDGNEFAPAWSPDGTQIVYDFTPEGENGFIWVMNADGTNKRPLTTHSENDTCPSFSPDGTQILFSSARDDNNGVYIMNADGGNVRRLTPINTTDINSSWSADGTQILFSRESGDGETADIYIMDADGTNERRLTSEPAFDFQPRWAPRKRGVEVSQSSVVIPDASALKATMAVQEVTANARGAVVRIETDLALASGFIIDPDGLILTNNHVVSDASEITVTLDDGTSHTATVQGRDLVHDLAVVRIEASGLPWLELGDLSQVPLGAEVLVLGFPLGTTDLTVSRGLASAFRNDVGRNIMLVQTDSAVNPGNSGGPLLNLQGQVVGVVAAKFVDVSIEGVGFAISVNTVILYLERLIAGEVIT